MKRKERQAVLHRKCLNFCAVIMVITAVTCNCGDKTNFIEKNFGFNIEKIISSDDMDSPYFFARILNVCANSQYIYVSDWKNYSITIFDHDFNFIKKIGEKGSGPNQFGQLFVNMACNEKNLYLLTINRLYTLSSEGDFLGETRLKFLPGQLFLLPDGFLLKRNSPGDVFIKTDAKGNTDNTFFKAPTITAKYCGKISANPQAFLLSKHELLVMSSVKYEIQSIDLSTKKNKMLIERDVEFQGISCTVDGQGNQSIHGGYSWILEGRGKIYYFYFNLKNQLMMDVFSRLGRNGVELKSTGKCIGRFNPLCIIPNSDMFVGIIPDETHELYVCRLTEMMFFSSMSPSFHPLLFNPSQAGCFRLP